MKRKRLTLEANGSISLVGYMGHHGYTYGGEEVSFPPNPAEAHIPHLRSTAQDPNDSEKWLNSAMTFSPTGSLVHKYDKIHPCVARFDKMDVDEQSSVTSGSSHQIGLSPLEIISRSGETWKIGVSICYDIRYPQFAAHHRRNGCDAIAYLTAWFPYTRSHWEPLMTARAIDNQCYVITPGQYGQHDEERSSLGGSAILDPWGVKLVSLPQIQHDVPSKGDVKGHEEDQRPTAVGGRWEVVNGYDDAWIGYGQLKKEVIKEIRQGLPVWDFGRDEVYGSGMRSANGNSEESLNGSRDVE